MTGPDDADGGDLYEGIAAITDDSDPVQVALDYVQGVFLGRVADPVQRWEAVARFTDELPAALDRVRGLSVGQLVHGGDSVQDAAEKLGVTRQRANAVMTGEGWPTPREEKRNPITAEPGYRYGVYLGVASVIAEVIHRFRPHTRARDIMDKLQTNAHGSTSAAVVSIAQAVTRWTTRNAPSARTRLAPLLDEFDRARAGLGELPAHLDIAQQSHMWVARSATRVRLAKATQH